MIKQYIRKDQQKKSRELIVCSLKKSLSLTTKFKSFTTIQKILMTLIIRILFFILQKTFLNLSVKNPSSRKRTFPANIKSNILHKKTTSTALFYEFSWGFTCTTAIKKIFQEFFTSIWTNVVTTFISLYIQQLFSDFPIDLNLRWRKEQNFYKQICVSYAVYFYIQRRRSDKI